MKNAMFALFFVLVSAGVLHSADTVEPPLSEATTETVTTEEAGAAETKAVEEIDEEPTSLDTTGLDFDSLGFGAGFGIMTLNKRNIKTAEIENDIVRVTKREDHTKSVWLESHYLISTRWSDYIMHGPFLALQVGSDNTVFDSYGLGWMISFQREKIQKASTAPSTKDGGDSGDSGDSSGDKTAFNIGVAFATTNVQVLGDGIVENAQIPTGVQNVRFRTENAYGLLVMVSFSLY